MKASECQFTAGQNIRISLMFEDRASVQRPYCRFFKVFTSALRLCTASGPKAECNTHMQEHEVAAFTRGLNAKLATRSRHVCSFLGAGASMAYGLPGLTSLEELVLKELPSDKRPAFERLRSEDRNLEHILSRLRRITALLQDEEDHVDGLTGKEARDLDQTICDLIVKALDITNSDLSPMLNFAVWSLGADYHLPVEIFTVNYDLAIETAMEKLGVPYFDGFIGSLCARFRTELVEAGPMDTDDWLPSFLVRLWKLHGSVNWSWDNESRAEVVRGGTQIRDNSLAAIYPSDSKYDESRRVPFVVLQDRFRRALHQPETLMLISGYSFGDEHLNEMIFDAARRRPRSEFIAFCFDVIPESLSREASLIPNLQVVAQSEAILGGRRGPWKVPEESELPTDIWNEDGFTLGDFAMLSSFLAKSSPPQIEVEARLAELLVEATSA